MIGSGVVQTKYGLVRGIEKEGYTLFKGIPYAAAPVGELRFQRPQPPVPWSGVRECNMWGPACPQKCSHTSGGTPWAGEFYYKDYPPRMDEDCLYLNIWTPAETGEDKLPVMMWIHGGGAQEGFGYELEFDGEALCRQKVILVTINYRLNIFGFFSHPELSLENPEHASGNYGIMDQRMALLWIRNNIGAFGGDPNNVTVFGQSGGGRSTQALACSPQTIGLFQHAAIHSAGGTRTGFGRLPQQVLEERGIRFMKSCGYSSIQELRAVPWQKLAETFYAYEKGAGRDGGFNIGTDGYMLTEAMEDGVIQGHQHDIDYIIGCTIEETKIGGPYDEPNKFCMFDVQKDWAQRAYKQGKKPMYVFNFDRRLPGKKAGAFENVAFHSCDLWYVFGTLDRCWRPLTEGDRELSERMIAYWTNFAKTGNPNGNGLENWKPFEDEEFVLHLNVKK